MNGFPEADTKDKFDTDEYRILVVANKYLTGFDQPKLCSMYVEKKLASVLCVQTLSRLNRSAPKLGKKTEDLFVLDFFNTIEDIKSVFDPFYTATSLSEATDINVLHELKDELGDVGVYEWLEVEEFVKRYFNNEDAQNLSPIIDIHISAFGGDPGCPGKRVNRWMSDFDLSPGSWRARRWRPCAGSSASADAKSTSRPRSPAKPWASERSRTRSGW